MWLFVATSSNWPFNRAYAIAINGKAGRCCSSCLRCYTNSITFTTWTLVWPSRTIARALIHTFFFQTLYVCIYRVQNVFLSCPTPRRHCFLSSHWPSFRFLSFMAFFIPSIQFFFGLPRALFCFGIHFNAILGSLSSAMSKLTNSKQTFLTKEFSARRNSGKARR